MNPNTVPCLPIPPPLKGAEAGTFTEHTIVERLPDILRRTLEENDFPAEVVEKLHGLLDEIPYCPIRPIWDPGAADVARWNAVLQPYLGLNWLDNPWLVVEFYFYRRILEATGYFQPGPGRAVDPFEPQKRQGLQSATAAIEQMVAGLATWLQGNDQEDALARLITADLWGNQADMSLFPAGSSAQPDHADEARQDEHTLINELSAALAYVNALPHPIKRIDFLNDNAGFELVGDLCLADFLLTTGMVSAVHFNLKGYPVFVSDALVKDVSAALDFLEAQDRPEIGACAARLRTHLARERLKLKTHPFWTLGQSLWEMPDDVRRDLGQAALVVSKGDANYRRLLGDRHWLYTVPFEKVVCYFPAPLLALRTLKAEVAAGLSRAQLFDVRARDPDWLTNGRWGVIQFFDPA